jgi:cell division protein FtsI/penicillin-binding protein 2
MLKKFKSSAKSSFVRVKRLVRPEESPRFRINLKGIEFFKETKRFYPNRNLAGHVLGFVGTDARGLEGVELIYDEYLRGGANRWLVRRDALGRTFLDPETKAPEKGRGSNLILTIDVGSSNSEK